MRLALSIIPLLLACQTTPASQADAGCTTASACGPEEYCVITEDYGRCEPLPEACGTVADCMDDSCRSALDTLCPDEHDGGDCSNPIDADANVTGNPVFFCS